MYYRFTPTGWSIAGMHTGTSLGMACVHDTFDAGCRYWYVLPLLLLFVIAAIKIKKFILLSVLLPATIIYYYVDDTRAGRILPSVPFFILFILSIILFAYSLKKAGFFASPQQQRFVVLTIVFIFFYLAFSALNFYTYRYMLAAIIPLLFLITVLFDKVTSVTYPSLYYPVAAYVLLVSFLFMKEDINDGEIRSTLDGMKVQQDVVDFMERNNLYGAAISSGSFLECMHLKDPGTGFTKSKTGFSNVRWEIDGNTQWAIFDNLEPDYRYANFVKDTFFRLETRLTEGALWAEIYRRK